MTCSKHAVTHMTMESALPGLRLLFLYAEYKGYGGGVLRGAEDVDGWRLFAGFRTQTREPGLVN
jgi:hypothetical protein